MHIFGYMTENSRALAALVPDDVASLRWGGNYAPTAATINGRCHIMTSPEQFAAMDAAGVAHPVLYQDLSAAACALAEGHIVLGRDIIHERGQGIVVAHNLEFAFQHTVSASEWRSKAFWTRHEPHTREWRFHIFRYADGHKSIFRALRREPAAGDPAVHGVNIRSLWPWDTQTEPKPALRETAKKACAAVGYDFGAVDLLERADGTACVLEVNSCPQIVGEGESLIAAYKRAIVENAAFYASRA